MLHVLFCWSRSKLQEPVAAAITAAARKRHKEDWRYINTQRSEFSARYSQNIRWSLWVSGTTCASHPSFLESSSGRYLKANEARCALHSCSSLPQLVTSCCFPAPWVDSSFVNSERASQPAIRAASERRTPLSLSLSFLLVLALLLSSSLSIALSSPRSAFLPPPSSPLLAQHIAGRRPLKAVHLAFRPRSPVPAETDQADLHRGKGGEKIQMGRGVRYSWGREEEEAKWGLNQREEGGCLRL